MTEQRFNRFMVTNARIVHFLDDPLPLSGESAWCGAKPELIDPWRVAVGDKSLPPGKGVNINGLPDCQNCVNNYNRRQVTGEKIERKPTQTRMF